jgi:hypothetical protein
LFLKRIYIYINTKKSQWVTQMVNCLLGNQWKNTAIPGVQCWEAVLVAILSPLSRIGHHRTWRSSLGRPFFDKKFFSGSSNWPACGNSVPGFHRIFDLWKRRKVMLGEHSRSRFLTLTVLNQDTYESRDQVATGAREGHYRGCMWRLQFLKSGQRSWYSHTLRL